MSKSEKNSEISQKLGKIVVILGPTSAGKSAVAIRLAQKFNGEIVSVDSRQIYRGMDVGTGKIIRDEKHKLQNTKHKQNTKYKIQNTNLFISENIVHHMIDIVSPKANFSAARFKKKADKIIKDILKRGKLPILCGGTGFWIKSIVDNVIYPEVKPDQELRKRLGIESTEKLFAMLQRLDPQRAENIDAKNKVRLIRAIEICNALGQVPKEKSNPQYKALQIGINPGKEKLHTKIMDRLNQRWKNGMIEEVENLRKKYKLNWEKIQSFGLGYFWIPEYLQEKITLKELYEKVYLAEKDYAKRQITWFAKDKRIMWLENYKDIEKIVSNFLSANS